MVNQNEIKNALEKRYENKKIICRCLITGVANHEIIEHGDIIVCKNCFELIKCFKSVEDIDNYNFSGGSFAEDIIDKMIVIDSESADKIKKSYGK